MDPTKERVEGEGKAHLLGKEIRKTVPTGIEHDTVLSEYFERNPEGARKAYDELTTELSNMNPDENLDEVQEKLRALHLLVNRWSDAKKYCEQFRQMH